MKTAVCCLVKNEQQDIEEWIAHHLHVGFDTIILFNNNSTDLTPAYARRAARQADVRMYSWPWFFVGSQLRAYLVGCHMLKQEFDWVAFFDSDEFLLPSPKTGLLDILEQRAEAAVVVINWALFGSSGYIDDPKEGVLASYLHRAPSSFGPNAHSKLIVRPGLVKRCINPHFFEVDGSMARPCGALVAWSDVEGITANIDHEGLRLNHYFTRSKTAWTRRMVRGQQAGSHIRTLTDFENYDRNEVFDDSALPFARRAAQRSLQFRLA